VSEYQYYDFRALDRPLTQRQQSALRTLSSRAEITSTSFTNSYDFGDFRGEPLQLMERYFDAFLYLAMIEFLRIDEDLLAAAKVSGGRKTSRRRTA
jgi:hypothetical protein